MKNYRQELATALSALLGVRNVVLFSSCRNAVYSLLSSLNLSAEDEVIIQSFICDSLPLAIKKAGTKPIFVDVNEKTFNLEAQEVEKKITSKTKAIIFVHTYGNPSGILEIKKLCQKHNLILIEDLAHALGASYDMQLAGTFGDYTVYSFTKQMVNFGGGAVLSNHNLAAVIKIRDSFNQHASLLTYIQRLLTSLYETRAFFLSKLLINLAPKKKKLAIVQELDAHFSCSTIEAYLALKQLPNFIKLINKRKENYLFLQQKHIKMQTINEKSNSSFNYLSFIFLDKEKRDIAIKNNFLFSRPWSGSNISDTIAFVPNSPYSSRRVRQIWSFFRRKTGW